MTLLRMRTFYLLICFLSACGFLSAQTQSGARGVISGVVTEKKTLGTGEAIIQATIRIMNPKDSTLVTGDVTDLDGNFEIKQLPWGSYLLQISYIGYNPHFQTVSLSAKQPRADIGNIALSAAQIDLNEIVVVGKATEVIVKTDTVEFNPNAYTAKENDVIEDLLKKLPGVEVGEDGKITYAGKEIEKILIDGKEFFGDDPTVASKNIPVEIIERLQVIDDKSDAAKRTGVDDGEKQKVINISVKKDKKKGWFGDANAGYGTKERYGAKAMVNRFLGDDKYTFLLNSNNTNNMGFGDRGGNMRGGGGYGGGIITSHSLGANIIKDFGKKVKTAGSFNLYSSNSDAQRKSERENLLRDSSYFSNSNNKRLADSKGLNLNYRIEYNPDTSNFFIFSPGINLGRNNLTTLDSTETLDGDRVHVNNGYSAANSTTDNLSLRLRMEYVHRFKKPGRSFGVNANGSVGTSNGDGDNRSRIDFYRSGREDSTSILDQRIYTRGDDQSIRASIFYTEPLFNKQNYLQFSYMVRASRNVSEKETYKSDPLSEQFEELDSLYTRGNRNIFLSHRIGLTYRVVRENYRYAIGARIEPSSTKSTSYRKELILADLPTRNVVNLSPNAMLRYKLANKGEITAEYEGRMQQPSAIQLMPVPDISNPLNITVGNPNLLPSFAHNGNIEFNRTSPEKQMTISTEVGWQMTQNQIISMSLTDQSGVRTTTYENVDGVWNTYGRFMISLPLKNKRFQFNTFTFARYSNNIGFTNGTRNVSRSTSISEMLQLRFRMDKLIETGVRAHGRYAGTVNSVQSTSDRQTLDYSGSYFFTLFLPLDVTVGSDIRYNGNLGYTAGYEKREWIWNAELMKSFLAKKNAIVTLRIYDILGQMKNISRSSTGTYIEDAEFNALTSYALLTFTYKFNTFGGKAPSIGGDPRRGGHGSRRF